MLRSKMPARAATAILLLAAAPAYAVDITATLKGTVTDPDGLPIPNAEVLLTSEQLQGDRQSLTDTEGRYRFAPLPPGGYVVKVVHPSFNSWESGVLSVDLGATVRVDVGLTVTDSGEVITVLADAPAIDVENVQTGVVLDAEFLKDIPSGRSYQSAVQVAPGVVGGGNPNMHGGFDTANQYYIDGVNTTDPLTNTFSMNMNYDAIDAIEVITGGLDAEYGRSLGGAVNIVTKSGGNDFEAFVNLLYSNADMIIAKELEGDDFGDFTEQQLVVNFGGPIVKDKVWFFTSFQGDRLVSSISMDPDEIDRDLDRFPLVPRDWRSMYVFGKITAQPTPAHRLWVHAQADPTWIDNIEQSPYVLPSAETVQNQGGWLGSIGHQFTPSDDSLLETQLFYEKSVINFFSILWKDCEEKGAYGECLDDFVGSDYMGEEVTEGWLGWDADDFSSGEFPYASFNRRYRMSANTSFTQWFDFLGEHKAKVGLQAEWLRSFYVYPGLDDPGIVYYNNVTDDPMDMDAYDPIHTVRYDNNLDRLFTGQIISWYIQDVWHPHPRLTIRPGLRWDAPLLKDDLGDPIYKNVTMAPRFGVAYQLDSEAKSSIHAFYGRFYDTGYLIISDLLQKESQGGAGYYWDGEAGDWETEPAYEWSGQFLAHDDLRNPYSDEINVGYSREIARDLGFDTTFIYEEARRFWEDDEVNLIWDNEGSNVIGYRNGENIAIYRLRTSDELWTRYMSLEFSLQKRFSENWGLLGSYTFSRSLGTNSADQATGFMDIAEQRKYEAGLLAYDVPHNIKLTGSYTKADAYSLGSLDGGYVLGWNMHMRSGYPYRHLVWNSYYGGYYNYDSTNDGTYRLPAYAQLDLRSGLTFEVGRAAWMLGLDVFNVFNDRTVTSVDTTFDPDATGDDQTFGDVLDRQYPRYFQFVARGEF